MSAIKKIQYMDIPHLEKRRGTPTEARDYCMKDETRKVNSTPTEVGDWKEVKGKQGTRSDIIAATDMIDSGCSMAVLAEALPGTYVRLHKGLEKYKTLRKPVRPDAPAVTLVFGPAGVGKTRLVRDTEAPTEENPDPLWVAPIGQSFKWFDGYENHEAALFDDFDGKLSSVPLSHVLPTIDRYINKVHIMCNFVWFAPLRIYITTNYHPSQWYDWGSRLPQYAALKRRFTNIVYWPKSSIPGDDPILLTPLSPEWDAFWDCQIADLF